MFRDDCGAARGLLLFLLIKLKDKLSHSIYVSPCTLFSTAGAAFAAFKSVAAAFKSGCDFPVRPFFFAV